MGTKPQLAKTVRKDKTKGPQDDRFAQTVPILNSVSYDTLDATSFDTLDAPSSDTLVSPSSELTSP